MLRDGEVVEMERERRDEWNCGIKWNKIAHGGQIHEPRVESIIIMDEKTFSWLEILYFSMLLKHKYTQHEHRMLIFQNNHLCFRKMFPFSEFRTEIIGKFISRVLFDWSSSWIREKIYFHASVERRNKRMKLKQKKIVNDRKIASKLI